MYNLFAIAKILYFLETGVFDHTLTMRSAGKLLAAINGQSARAKAGAAD
jgi:hypothetical protein